MITRICQWNCIHHAKYIYVINFIHEDSFIHARYNSLNRFYNVHLFSIWGPLMWSHFYPHACLMHVCGQLHHEQIFIHLVYVNIKIVFLFILVFESNLFNNLFFSPCIFFSSVFSVLYASICPFTFLPLSPLFPYHLVFSPLPGEHQGWSSRSMQ
jgi:hypothetical protein